MQRQNTDNYQNQYVTLDILRYNLGDTQNPINIQQQSKQLHYDTIDEACPQFVMISPNDTILSDRFRQQLEYIDQNYSQNEFIEFVEKNNKNFGIPNARNLKKIDKQFFWGAAVPFMIQCAIRDTDKIQGKIQMLFCGYKGIVNMKKYQIFLILCHMFFGTLPPQKNLSDVTLGKLMCIYDNEDESSNRQQIMCRFTKLKCIVTYFIQMAKRNNDIKQIQQIIVFERTQENSEQIFYQPKLQNINDTISNNPLTKLQVSQKNIIEHQKQHIIVTYCNKEIGKNIYNKQTKQVVDSLFFTHPQLIVLKALAEQLDDNQTILVFGVQRFSTCKHQDQKFIYAHHYEDKSQTNSDEMKNSIFIFLNTNNYQQYQPSIQYKLLNIKNQIKKWRAGLQACQIYCRKKSRKYCIGKWGNNKFGGDWQKNLLILWVVATLAKRKLIYCIDNGQICAKQLQLLINQLQHLYTLDLIQILRQYNKFRFQQSSQITLFDYIKDFL